MNYYAPIQFAVKNSLVFEEGSGIPISTLQDYRNARNAGTVDFRVDKRGKECIRVHIPDSVGKTDMFTPVKRIQEWINAGRKEDERVSSIQEKELTSLGISDLKRLKVIEEIRSNRLKNDQSRSKIAGEYCTALLDSLRDSWFDLDDFVFSLFKTEKDSKNWEKAKQRFFEKCASQLKKSLRKAIDETEIPKDEMMKIKSSSERK